jgi:enoyl-CoA hydratase
MGNVKRDRVESIEVVTLARPPANALDIDTTEEIAATFEAIASDDSARAAVLTGDGKAFCAGLDLKLVPQYGPSEQRRLIDAINKMVLATYGCPMPVIGAINGHAIAGGFVLAMCCDWKIVTESPLQAGLTEVRVGVPYPAAAIEVVRSELPARVARELTLFGKNMNGTDALAAGIFDESAPLDRLFDRAMEKARESAELPRRTFATIKHQLRKQALATCSAAVSGEGEPLRDGWIQGDAAAASRILSHK